MRQRQPKALGKSVKRRRRKRKGQNSGFSRQFFGFHFLSIPFSHSHGNKFAVPAFQVNSPDVFRHHPVPVTESVKGFTVRGVEQTNQNAVY